MKITYMDPLSRAWKRMTKALFKPFDLKKWFVVGFTAFLAGLMDGYNGGNKVNSSFHKDYNDFDKFFEFPHTAWNWLMNNTGWAILIFMGILCIIALILLLTWLSSRGKFMFLDNVMHDRAQVVKSWYDFKKQGNSLFLWRLCFGLICSFIFILFLIQCLSLTKGIYETHFSEYIPLMTIVGMVLLGVLLIFIIAFIVMLVDSFIVPLMYKHNLSALQAWNKFLPLLSRHLLYFILFGLLLFVIHIVLLMFIVVFGFFTCCLGFVLLVLPYISSVVLLPVSYTLRGFSVEFFAQFGSEFSLIQTKKRKTAKSSKKK